ncbi:MAG: universal stress protein [Vicinamibacterales bacterium]
MPYRSVIGAVDLDKPSRHLVYHAAGMAAAAGVPLTLVSAIGPDQSSADATSRLERLFADAVPYDVTAIPDPAFLTVHASPVEGVLEAARARGAGLIVAGTRARGELARLLLGSASADLLQQTDRPLLLVPPTDIDIVTMVGGRASLHFGAVLLAIDLAESNSRQHQYASAMAALARQPLLALTVADKGGPPDRDVAAALRSAVADVGPVAPSAFIVRRGDPAQEIARAARAEQSGLVVMGLRSERRGRPGSTATAVLQSHRALVLAVPDR